MNDRCPVAEAELAHDHAQSKRDTRWESCITQATLQVNGKQFTPEDLVDALKYQFFDSFSGITPQERRTWWTAFSTALVTDKCAIAQQLHSLLVEYLAEQNYTEQTET